MYYRQNVLNISLTLAVSIEILQLLLRLGTVYEYYGAAE